MIEVQVSETIDAPAEKVWELLSWRGVERLRGAVFFETITFEDELNEAGSIRVLHMPDGSVIREVAEELSEAGRFYTYRPLSLGSLPVTDYRGRVAVTEDGPGRCRVTISSRCTPIGITEEEWRCLYTTMETAVIALVRTKIEGT